MPKFHHQIGPDCRPGADDLLFATSGMDVLVSAVSDAQPVLPRMGALQHWLQQHPPTVHVGTCGERHLWFVETPGSPAAPDGFQWISKRTLIPLLDPGLLQGFYCALSIGYWSVRTRFCGVCGTETQPSTAERMRVCPNCGATFYPTPSPAIIVGVTRGDELLLAHNSHFKSGMHSIIAGFVDPGETFEQAIHRELQEEVSISVRNIRYIRSQPWPFPNSLMIGFMAEYDSGEIQVDGVEIENAGWFTRDSLPELPQPGSVARELIDAWRNHTLTT